MASPNAGPITGRELIKAIQGGTTVYLTRSQMATLLAKTALSSPRPMNTPTAITGAETVDALQAGTAITMGAADLVAFAAGSDTEGTAPDRFRATEITGTERVIGDQGGWNIAWSLDEINAIKETVAPTPSGYPTVVPAAGWSGTATNNGLAASDPGFGNSFSPTLDTTIQGSSGWAFPCMAEFFEFDGVWVGFNQIDDIIDFPITIQASSNHPAGMKEVRVYCENSTPVVISQRSFNTRTKDFGFVFMPTSRVGQNGEARITVDAIPNEGAIVRRNLLVTLNTDTGTVIVRPERFVDPVAGNDGNTGTEISPWQSWELSVAKMTGALDGGILRMAAGSYVLNNNGSTLRNNTRQVSVAPKAGVTRDQITLSWQSRTLNSNTRGPGVWQPRTNLLEIYGCRIDTANMVQVWSNNINSRLWLRNVHLFDSNGVAGPKDLSPAWTKGGDLSAESPLEGTGYWTVSQVFFKVDEGQNYAVTESTIDQYVFTGVTLSRNNTGFVSFDCLFVGPSVAGGHNGTRYSNTVFRADQSFPQKRHLEDYLEVATAVYDGIGFTTIVPQGSPTLIGNPNNQPMSAYKFLTGANVGRSSGTNNALSYEEQKAYGGAHLWTQNLANLTCTVSPGSPAVFNSSLHKLRPGCPVTFTTNGTLPTGITAGQTYYVLSAGISASPYANNNTFQVSATVGGSPIAVADAGTGQLRYSMPAIIIEGDFSTATGGTVVGDRVRGYIIAHLDPLQVGGPISVTANGPMRDLMLQNYRCTGNGIGNMWIIQTMNGGTTQSAATVSVPAGSITATFSAAPNPLPRVGVDFLKIRSAGATRAQYARIIAFDAGTNTATLSKPLSAATTGAQFIFVNSAMNFTLINCIIAVGDVSLPESFFQWQDALVNVGFFACTFIGRRSAGATQGGIFLFRDSTGATPGNASADGLLIEDCIFDIITAESGNWPGLAENARTVNSRARRGTAPNAGVTIGEVNFDADYRPTFTGAPTTVASPRFGWGFNLPGGDPSVRGAGSPVGAMAA